MLNAILWKLLAFLLGPVYKNKEGIQMLNNLAY